MSLHHDTELDDVLQDQELQHIADLLRSARRSEPPLDDALRSELRRTLMQKAWEAGEGRAPWWSRLMAPQGLDRKSTRLNSSHTEIYTLSLHDALPIYDAFRSELRRTLMQKAWEAGEGRAPWWSRLMAPQG